MSYLETKGQHSSDGGQVEQEEDASEVEWCGGDELT